MENVFEDKQRVIQEYVPGKQTTMAHLIANPKVITENRGALGIMTITPSEAAIIGADVATKAAAVDIVFVDRFSGSLVICGDVSSVEAALIAVNDTLSDVLGFSPAKITRT